MQSASRTCNYSQASQCYHDVHHHQGDCTMLTREHCLAADASDKLASLRQQFRLPSM
jgi:hypothetical protein